MLERRNKFGIFDVFNVTFLTLYGLIMVFPFYNAVIISLSNETTFLKSPMMLYPKVIDFYSYKIIFEYGGLGRSFFNTLLIVVFGVSYNMLLTITMAYGFSKKNFPGRNFLFNIVIFTMYLYRFICL